VHSVDAADAIKAMKDKVHPRNIAWIRENAERRVAELLEDQEEEPDEALVAAPSPSQIRTVICALATC
jgi:hypothetical protein